MEKNTITFVANPKIDFLFGMYGGNPIPSKQDAYKPIDVSLEHEDG